MAKITYRLPIKEQMENKYMFKENQREANITNNKVPFILFELAISLQGFLCERNHWYAPRFCLEGCK